MLQCKWIQEFTPDDNWHFVFWNVLHKPWLDFFRKMTGLWCSNHEARCHLKGWCWVCFTSMDDARVRYHISLSNQFWNIWSPRNKWNPPSGLLNILLVILTLPKWLVLTATDSCTDIILYYNLLPLLHRKNEWLVILQEPLPLNASQTWDHTAPTNNDTAIIQP